MVLPPRSVHRYPLDHAGATLEVMGTHPTEVMGTHPTEVMGTDPAKLEVLGTDPEQLKDFTCNRGGDMR